MITQARLKELLHYDPETGVFTRRITIRGRWKAGSQCGMLDDHGYIKIRVDGVRLRAHRLAFIYMIGSVPKEIDHINGVRGDNRWANLRDCSRSENQQNIGSARADNKCGLSGVSFNKTYGMYVAQIQINKKKIMIGKFDSPEVAHEAYLNAKLEYHTHHERMLGGAL